MKIKRVRMRPNEEKPFAKGRIYFFRIGEKPAEDLLTGARWNRPHKEFRKHLCEIWRRLQIDPFAVHWSQKAGCSCGCSPGFISEAPALRGKDVFVDYEVRSMKIKDLTELNEAEQFFFEHAGYSYDPKRETEEQGRIRYAQELAEAEQWAHRQGIVFFWDSDPDQADHWVCEARLHNRTMTALFDIDLASSPELDDYARVVPAEMALDLMESEPEVQIPKILSRRHPDSPEWHGGTNVMMIWEAIQDDLAEMLRASNPDFDLEAFRLACRPEAQ